MKILLTGATGFIGRHFLDSLSEKYEVVALVRDIKKLNFCRGKISKVIVGDLRDADIFEGIPQGVNLVCHAAGVLGKWGLSADIYKETNIQGTKNLLYACLKKKIKRIIYISSAGVLGAIKNKPLDEDYPYNPKSIYEITKAEAEKFILKFSKENGIRINILRPEFVYGEGNLHILGLFKAINDQKFFFVGNGDTLIHPTYIGDLVHALHLIIEVQQSSDIYLVAGERFLTVRELAVIIAKLIGVSPPKINIPYFLAKIAALSLEISAKIGNFPPPFTQSRLDFFTKDKAYCIKRAVSELNYTPMKLEQGLLNTILWYKKNGYLF